MAQSPLSKLFGVRTSLLGSLWAIAMLGASLVPPSRPLAVARRVLALGGLVVAVGFQGYAWLSLREFCLWCALSAVGIVVSSGIVLRDRTREVSVQTNVRAVTAALFALGMLPYLGVSQFASPMRRVAMTDFVSSVLHARAEGRPLQTCLFFFTDFACPHCHEALPKAMGMARSRGLKLVALPIVRIPARGNGKSAAYYYVASWRGFGENYLRRHPGESGLREYSEVAERELSPTPTGVQRAERLLSKDQALFNVVGATGTPTLAMAEPNGLRVGTLAAFIGVPR